jgi:hypothetical protein
MMIRLESCGAWLALAGPGIAFHFLGLGGVFLAKWKEISRKKKRKKVRHLPDNFLDVQRGMQGEALPMGEVESNKENWEILSQPLYDVE